MDIESYLKSIRLDCETIKFNRPLPYKLCADAVAHPYWGVNSSTWDDQVVEAAKQGKVILNHKITPDSILMDFSMFERLLTTADKLTFDDMMEIENTILEKWTDESDKIDASGKLAPGFMFSTGVADGSAHYKVVKVNPKSVRYELRKFCDGYMDRVLGVDGTLTTENFKRITRFGMPSLFNRKRYGE